jgi:hypothetical protein
MLLQIRVRRQLSSFHYENIAATWCRDYSSWFLIVQNATWLPRLRFVPTTDADDSRGLAVDITCRRWIDCVACRNCSDYGRFTDVGVFPMEVSGGWSEVSPTYCQGYLYLKSLHGRRVGLVHGSMLGNKFGGVFLKENWKFSVELTEG